MNASIPQLDWTAFCYVADELSPAEKERFEQRLAVDQDACEAVVRAMQMCEGVAELPAQTVVPATPQPATVRKASTFAGWAAVVVTAACVLVAVGTMLSRPGANDLGSSELAADPDANHLVGYWAAANAVVGGESDNEDIELAMDQVSLDEDVIVPDWLFVAVSSDAAELERSLEESELQHN